MAAFETASSIAATTTSLGAFERSLSPDAIEDATESMIGARASSSTDVTRAFAVARATSLIAAILSPVGAPETPW